MARSFRWLGRLPVLLGASLLAWLVASDGAQAYCSEPTAPSCATRSGSFDDQDEFDRCRRQMTNYKSEVEDNLSCRQREYSDMVESFNRRARR